MVEIRVALLIVKKGRILLVKHSKNKEEYWVIPGGRLKEKETLKEAIEREMEEELNLKVNIKKLLYIKEIILEKRHILNIFFLGSIKKGKIKLKKTKVLKEAKFFPIEGLDKIKFLPPIAKIIKKSYRNNFKEEGKYIL